MCTSLKARKSLLNNNYDSIYKMKKIYQTPSTEIVRVDICYELTAGSKTADYEGKGDGDSSGNTPIDYGGDATGGITPAKGFSGSLWED